MYRVEFTKKERPSFLDIKSSLIYNYSNYIGYKYLKKDGVSMNLDFKELEDFVTQQMSDFNVPSMSIAVVQGEEAIYTKCFGYKDVENQIAPDENTVYAIASLSKAMTATCVGILVDEGKLSWDVPVINYLPEFRLQDEFATKSITLRDMLSHNTGLPRHDTAWYNTDESDTTANLVERMRYLKFNKSPRSLYEYNNFMFTAAGYVIERVTGVTWDKFIDESIFKPLGMSNSSAVVVGLAEAENKALPYKPVKNVPNDITLSKYLNFDGMGACGSVNSTISDMSKWASMNLMGGTYKGKTILSGKALKEIHTPNAVQRAMPTMPEIPIICYGLGWGARVYRGHYNLSHSGGIDGFSTHISLLPNSNVGIIILTNVVGTNVHFAVANTFKDFMLGLPEKDWAAHMKNEMRKMLDETIKKNDSIIAARKSDAAPSTPIENYVGVYEHKGYGKVTVTLKDSKLHMSFNGASAELVHSNYDTFDVDLFDNSVTSLIPARFFLNKTGEVSEFHVELEQALGGEMIAFMKVG